MDEGWEFRRLAGAGEATCMERVSLPHSAVETTPDGHGHWQGLCEYSREVRAQAAAPGSRQVLWVGGAMHTATVKVDGRELAVHRGGYLPFEVDLTQALADGAAHQLSLELDNRDNGDVPPGKPLADLDFCWYGGLYRGVELRVYPAVHITDELTEGRVAGGGVFFRTLEASPQAARCAVTVDIRGAGAAGGQPRLRARLLLAGGEVAGAEASCVSLDGGLSRATLELAWNRPRLWSVDDPALHTLVVELVAADGAVLDARELRVGVRRIGFSRSGGFTLNGRRVRLRGTNRHQEYPRIGYAVGEAADRRDARRIKEAGFDYIRLSHYPQSPAFLDACDELGIVVMNAIPGWQYMGGKAFRDACVQTSRELVRRDRNHACVVLWELSLNETQMDEAFMRELHEAGHEEYPGDQMFTCGWMNAFDVYIHARQHGHIQTWVSGDTAHLVSEYGDWEFYAANHGFDQKTGAGVHAAWSNSRHFRGDGERGLLQQAANFTLALNDTLSSPAVLCGQWCMFDYARGYHPLRAACGVSDVHRVPKFAWHFYRSQRDPREGGAGWTGGAMVFIASHWLPTSNLQVTVFSNCEEVELRLNGRVLSRQRPSMTVHTQYLPHPPFVFHVPSYEGGELRAIGHVGGAAVAEHRVATPLEPAALRLEADEQGIRAGSLGADVIVVNARVIDSSGTLCVGSSQRVVFTARGCEIIGSRVVEAEAGIASLLVRVQEGAVGAEIEAEAGNMRASLALGA